MATRFRERHETRVLGAKSGEVYLTKMIEQAAYFAKAAFLVVLVLLTVPTGAGAGPYIEGDFIEITGTVTDGTGTPIPDVHVVFRAAKKSFSVYQFGQTTKDEVSERYSLRSTKRTKGELMVSER